MRTIFKYPLDLGGSWPQVIATSGTPVFRHFDMQGDTPCVWAEVDPNAAVEETKVVIVGTGHSIPDGFRYFGTAMHGQFVWHLYVEQENG